MDCRRVVGVDASRGSRDAAHPEADGQRSVHPAAELRARRAIARVAMGVHGVDLQGLEYGAGCVVVECGGPAMRGCNYTRIDA